MVRLRSYRKHSPLTERVSATADVPNLGSGKNEILVAHQFRNSCCHFRNDSHLQTAQFIAGSEIAQEMVAELADRHASDRSKCTVIKMFIDDAGYIVFHQRIGKDVG